MVGSTSVSFREEILFLFGAELKKRAYRQLNAVQWGFQVQHESKMLWWLTSKPNSPCHTGLLCTPLNKDTQRTGHDTSSAKRQSVSHLVKLFLILQVSSARLIREVLLTQQDVFSGRAHYVKIAPFLRHDEDVNMAGGVTRTWREKKKALTTSMRM